MVGNSRSPFGLDVDELLSSHGISPTQQRRQIARILFTHPQHLSAEQILERINGESERPIVSKATVYNTLGLFTRKGMVREVVVDPSKVFYDSNTAPHHHFFDQDTGSLIDIDAGQITLSQLPTPPEGMQLDGVDIIVRVRSNG